MIGPRITYFMRNQNTFAHPTRRGLSRGAAPGCPIDYRPGHRRERSEATVLAYSALQWFFVILLVALVGGAGVFALFVVAQLFRNPGRR